VVWSFGWCQRDPKSAEVASGKYRQKKMLAGDRPHSDGKPACENGQTPVFSDGESRELIVPKKTPKSRVCLCRKNGSNRDLNQLRRVVILRPFRSGIQVRIPEIIGSWVLRRRVRVDERLVARNAVCEPRFGTARANRRPGAWFSQCSCALTKLLDFWLVVGLRRLRLPEVQSAARE
jgi:hypothetical protein